MLGQVFEARALEELLMKAIRYGEDPKVRKQLFQEVDNAADHNKLLGLMEEHALVRGSMRPTNVEKIREGMERAAARRLQPFHIQAFFLEALKRWHGKIRLHEPGRWEITQVPRAICNHASKVRGIIQPRYERVCFDQEKIDHDQCPVAAAWLCPGHPLLDATVDLVWEENRDLLQQGAVLVDETDDGEELRVLFYLEHAVQDGRMGRDGRQQVISRRLRFVRVDRNGHIGEAGPAPYLDYRPLAEEERSRIAEVLKTPWLTDNIENKVLAHATCYIGRPHLKEVCERRSQEIDKVKREVTKRLKGEINRYEAQERDGGKRARKLAERLERRCAALDLERNISALPPQLCGGALIVPAGLLSKLTADAAAEPAATTAEVGCWWSGWPWRR